MKFGRSIEFRLAAWYSLLLFAGLASLGAVLWYGVNYSMVAAVDDLLSARVEYLSEIDMDPEDAFAEPDDLSRPQELRDAPGSELEPPWELEEELREYVLTVPDGRLTQIRAVSGRVLLPLSDTADEQALVPWQGVHRGDRSFSTVATPRGLYRALSAEALLAGEPYQVQVASSLAHLTATRRKLLMWLMWAVPAGLVMSIWGGYVISRVALRPVEKVVNVAGRMDVDSLSERLEVPATGDVVQRLAETFNLMLGRLGASVNRLEQFTADASHELRSPVSVIRTTAELALRQARSEQELRHDMQEIRDEAVRLTGLIEDLLILARADSGLDFPEWTGVDLEALVSEVIEHYRRSVGGRILRAEIADTDTLVEGHAPSLRRLLITLLDNAVQHTPDGSSIRVSVRREAAGLVLSVADTGPGIPAAALERVFDRFYRVDPSRNRSNGGFGLGLSIARCIAESHGGSISATSRVGEGSKFRVVLPAGLEGDSPSNVA